MHFGFREIDIVYSQFVRERESVYAAIYLMYVLTSVKGCTSLYKLMGKGSNSISGCVINMLEKYSTYVPYII